MTEGRRKGGGEGEEGGVRWGGAGWGSFFVAVEIVCLSFTCFFGLDRFFFRIASGRTGLESESDRPCLCVRVPVFVSCFGVLSGHRFLWLSCPLIPLALTPADFVRSIPFPPPF